MKYAPVQRATAEPEVPATMNPPGFIYHDEDPLLEPLVRYLRRHPKRIVFPDGQDLRVLRAAAELARLEAVAPVLLGNRVAIQSLAREHGVKLDFVGIIDPEASHDFERFCELYRKVSRYRKAGAVDPREVMSLPGYFAAMMLQYGYADGAVGGNQMIPAAWFRALQHLIRKLPGIDAVSSCAPLRLPDRPEIGCRGTLVLADCAVIPSPTVSQLAMIAVESAKVAAALLPERPRVAMVSFSTRGSATHASAHKVAAATGLAREHLRSQRIDAEIDGELEVDAAVDPETARLKAPGSPLGGRANVLVFPDLDAAHSAFKLLECTARAQSAGQQILGLARPAAQVSRGASWGTVFAAALATAMRAVSFRSLIENERG